MVLVGGHHVASENVELDAAWLTCQLLERQRGFSCLDSSEFIRLGQGLLIGQQSRLTVTTPATKLTGCQILWNSIWACSGGISGQDFVQRAGRRTSPSACFLLLTSKGQVGAS